MEQKKETAAKKERTTTRFSRSLLLRVAILGLCTVAALPNLPVNCFSISSRGKTLCSSPAPNATAFVATYIHSVQLTPVIDDYRISCGTIWIWEERVRSHNAGLPFDAPERGRFLMRPPWMIVQGGRRRFKEIAYRVGTEEFGKNVWRLRPFTEIEAYKKYPSARVVMSADIVPLYEAKTVGFRFE